jgi:hypothetical protein
MHTKALIVFAVLTYITLSEAYIMQPNVFSSLQRLSAAHSWPKLRLSKPGACKTAMKIPGIEFVVQALSPKPATFSTNPIVAVVQDRDEGKLRTLLSQGADVNGYDPSLGNGMHWIAEKGHYQYPPSGIPKMLVGAGLDLNAKNPAGATALEISLLRGWQKISMLLLDSGADRSVVTETVKSRITCPDCKKVVRDYQL